MTTFPRRRQRRPAEPAGPLVEEIPLASGSDGAASSEGRPAAVLDGLAPDTATHGSVDRRQGPSAADARREPLPGALVVIDEQGLVQRATEQCEQLFGLGPGGLVGADLYSLIDPDDATVLRWSIDEQAAGSDVPRRVMLTPPLVRIHTPSGATRLAELWATGPGGGDGEGKSVLLRDRSILYGINSALAWVLDGAPLAEGLLMMARVLGCEPAGHTCFFVTADSEDRRAARIPDDSTVPGPPAGGPWSVALWSALSSEHSTLDGLTPELQGAARSAGYAALRCYPVQPPGSGLVKACLVAWSRDEGPLSAHAETAFRQALMASAIALTMRPEEWELSETDRAADAERDPITGLPNAEALIRSLDAILADRGHPAVLCIGIRGLAGLHEQYGPLAVGTIERVAAQRLHSKIRRTDDVYRYGEGTFAVIYEGKLAPDRIRGVAARILAHVTTPVRFGTSSIAEIEASVGISIPSVAITTGQDLVSQAYTALESAWRKGPSRGSFTVPTAGH